MLDKSLKFRLSDAEEQALMLWADADAIDNKSLMMRRVLRLALRKLAPRSIFPKQIITALNLAQDAEAKLNA